MATAPGQPEFNHDIMKIKNLLAFGVYLLLIPTIKAVGQQVLPLYDGKIPNSIDKPDQ